MTLSELLDELPGLGPWVLRGRTGVLRNAKGDCPLTAIARRLGFPVVVNNVSMPTERIATWLDMDLSVAAAVTDAADNLGLTMSVRDGGRTDYEVRRLRFVRGMVLKACGIECSDGQ